MKTKLLISYCNSSLFLISSIIPSAGLQVKQVKIESNNTAKSIEEKVKGFLAMEEIDINKDLEKELKK